MSTEDEIKQLLSEIRDNQRLSLQHQEDHLELARQQLERAKSQLTESVELQRQGIDRIRMMTRVALPAVVLCLILIVYLIIKYL